ncbi:MAG TPA: hypothetical protein VFB50_12410 [Chloroflexota bacterium]|nr:hypothetical protein [Chloroflexota bacterium]
MSEQHAHSTPLAFTAPITWPPAPVPVTRSRRIGREIQQLLRAIKRLGLLLRNQELDA